MMSTLVRRRSRCDDSISESRRYYEEDWQVIYMDDLLVTMKRVYISPDRTPRIYKAPGGEVAKIYMEHSGFPIINPRDKLQPGLSSSAIEHQKALTPNEIRLKKISLVTQMKSFPIPQLHNIKS